MPTLIDTDKLIEDSWIKLDDNDGFVKQSRVIVSFDRLSREYQALFAADIDVGLELEPDQNVEDIVPYLNEVKLVVLQFGFFADGRAFSQARLLRDRYAYSGDIRATGDVVPDQLGFMQRCGFNQFQIGEDVDSDLALQIFDQMQFGYQNDLIGTAHR